MRHDVKSFSVCLLLASGAATGLSLASEPGVLHPSVAPVVEGGHIYYNALTGERVLTLPRDGQVAPADTGNSVPIWVSNISNTCEAAGYATSFFFGVSDPTGGTPLSSEIAVLDMGDIELDTVVDCIQINWVVAYPDEWANGNNSDDGVVGVEELAGRWRVWDADNGEEMNQSTRLPLMDFTFFNLPGNTPDNVDAGALTGWTADVDLSVDGSFGSDLTFEIGDSDGDCQGAAFCNNDVDTDGDGIGDGVSIANADRDFDGMPDADLDGDGYFDWSWTVRFYAPGTGNDFDSDSDTGTAPGSDSDYIAVTFGAPEGEAIDNGDGTWTWDVDETAPAAGIGAEDRIAAYEFDEFDEPVFLGEYTYGGFACSGGLISTGGTGYTPPAMLQFKLYGPGEDLPCPGDCNGDGELNFFDITCFIMQYNADDDYNGDGVTDFFDVSEFLMDFNMGCP